MFDIPEEELHEIQVEACRVVHDRESDALATEREDRLTTRTARLREIERSSRIMTATSRGYDGGGEERVERVNGRGDQFSTVRSHV